MHTQGSTLGYFQSCRKRRGTLALCASLGLVRRPPRQHFLDHLQKESVSFPFEVIFLAECHHVQVTYTLTQADFAESLIAHRDRAAVRKWGIRITKASLFIFLAVALCALGVRHDANTFKSLLPFFIAVSIWLFFLFYAPHMGAKEQFRKQPGAQEVVTMSADERGIKWTRDGGSSEAKWSMFIQFIESPNQFLLYSSPVIFHIVPKSVFSTEGGEEFRKLLETHIRIVK